MVSLLWYNQSRHRVKLEDGLLVFQAGKHNGLLTTVRTAAVLSCTMACFALGKETGSTPMETRTLATWIVAHPAAGVHRVWVKIANPGEPEKTADLRLNSAVWANGLKGMIFR